MIRLAFWRKRKPARGKSKARPELLQILLRKVHCLSKQRGYCYATNSYFCREAGSPLAGKHPKTIMRYLRDLKTEGLIQVTLLRNGTRHMILTAAGLAAIGITPEQNASPLGQNVPTPGQIAPAYVRSLSDPQLINNKEKETSVRTSEPEIIGQRSPLGRIDVHEEIRTAQEELARNGICISRAWPKYEKAEAA